MKKKILISFILSLCAIFSFAQFPDNSKTGNPTTLAHNTGAITGDAGIVLTRFSDTTTANLNYISGQSGGQIIVGNIVYVRDSTAAKWLNESSGGGIIPGGAITTIPVVGTNPGTDLTSTDWIINTFYGTQSPTASLSGGGIFEFTSASTMDETLNWGAGRQSATQPLLSIVVAGITQSFSQPSAPGTVTGTQDVTVTTNTSTTYSNVVTTTDSKTATASTTFTFESKYYIGFVNTPNPTDGDIIAALGTAAGGVFATSRLTAGTLPDPASSSYIVFAYPTSFGDANIKINGLIVGYTLTTRSFTNASGYSVSYNIYVSPFETAGGVDYQVL